MAEKTNAKWVSSKKYPGVKWLLDKRGNRIFYVTFRDKSTGKFVWEKVGNERDGYSLEIAQDIRAARVKSSRHGEELPQHRKVIPLFSQVAESYLSETTHKKSHREDVSRYKDHLKERFADIPVDKITPLQLEKAKRELSAAGKAPGTVKQVLALFRAIFNKGREWGMIHCENPMSKVKMPNVDNARERFLSQEEIALLLDRLRKHSPQSYGVALLALNTGARKGEILGLRWADIDLTHKTLTFRNTKNGETRRISLNSHAMGYLSTLEKGGPSSHVFTTLQGNAVVNMTKNFDRIANELFNQGLAKDDRRSKVVFHTLRHTAASHMVMAGVPLATVKEILGHSTLAMVDRYSHLAPEAQRKALEILGEKTSARIPLETNEGAHG